MDREKSKAKKDRLGGHQNLGGRSCSRKGRVDVNGLAPKISTQYLEVWVLVVVVQHLERPPRDR